MCLLNGCSRFGSARVCSSGRYCLEQKLKFLLQIFKCCANTSKIDNKSNMTSTNTEVKQVYKYLSSQYFHLYLCKNEKQTHTTAYIKYPWKLIRVASGNVRTDARLLIILLFSLFCHQYWLLVSDYYFLPQHWKVVSQKGLRFSPSKALSTWLLLTSANWI